MARYVHTVACLTRRTKENLTGYHHRGNGLACHLLWRFHERAICSDIRIGTDDLGWRHPKCSQQRPQRAWPGHYLLGAGMDRECKPRQQLLRK